jgi:DNA-binding transcriptional regulator LsrR (DeoR family)
MKTRKIDQLGDDVIFSVCEKFMDGVGASGISNWLQAKNLCPFEPTRELIYPIVAEGRRRGFLQLKAPSAMRAAREVALQHSISERALRVVNVRGSGAFEHTAYAAADLAIEAMREMASGLKRSIHVGLGAGTTTMLVAQRLAERLRTERVVEKLTLHALSSGFSVESPQTAPVSFFSLFHAARCKVDYVGLFASPFVETGDYERLVATAGVRESMRLAGQIDLVITGFASAADSHGALRLFLDQAERPGRTAGLPDADRDRRDLKAAGWVGDVQYRPYSQAGPIRLERGIRAVTLFELDDLAALAARSGKRVILVAGPCGGCGKTRAPALAPLLTNPSLKVWSDIVLDIATAERLVPPPIAPPA